MKEFISTCIFLTFGFIAIDAGLLPTITSPIAVPIISPVPAPTGTAVPSLDTINTLVAALTSVNAQSDPLKIFQTLLGVLLSFLPGIPGT